MNRRELSQLWVPWSLISPIMESTSSAQAAFPLGFATCKPWFELVVTHIFGDESKWQYIIIYHNPSRLHAVPDIVSRGYETMHDAQRAAEDDWSSLCEERGYPRLSESEIAEREGPCQRTGCNCTQRKNRKRKTFIRSLIDGEFDRLDKSAAMHQTDTKQKEG